MVVIPTKVGIQNWMPAFAGMTNMTNTHKGCLVVHGLSGTPANMQPIREALEAKGYLVSTPLLAGHGHDLATLGKSTAAQWYESILKAYQDLSRQTDEIYYVGLSMGSIVGLKLAEELGSKIKALALLSPPLQYSALLRFVIMPGIRYTPLRWFIHSTAKDFEKSVLDPEQRKLYQANSVGRIPCACVIELLDLTKEVFKNLSKIDQPLLVLQGKQDYMLDEAGVKKLKTGIRSKKFEAVVYPKSSHVLSLDYDRKEVAQKIIDFFEII